MSAQRVVRRPPAKSAAEDSSGGKLKWILAAVFLLVAAGAWAFYPSTDPGLARIDELRTQIENAPEGQRRELYGKMREEYRNLSPEAQDAMRDEWRRRGEERENKRLVEFFALSPKEQIAKLDEDIKEDEERRKRWEKARAERGDSGRGNRGDGGRRGSGRSSNGDPNARAKRYLDNSSPAQRAMRTEYARMRAERSERLGRR